MLSPYKFVFEQISQCHMSPQLYELPELQTLPHFQAKLNLNETLATRSFQAVKHLPFDTNLSYWIILVSNDKEV